jgi:hypothetical protein
MYKLNLRRLPYPEARQISACIIQEKRILDNTYRSGDHGF